MARNNPRETGQRARALALSLGACLIAIPLGCDRPSPTISRELYELERLAFLPAGRAYLPGYREPFDVFSIDEPLVIDRYEATLGDWRYYFEEAEPWKDSNAELEREPDTWPVSLTRPEAERLAEVRGMRLLFASEWIYCAVGSRGHPFPWGSSPQSSVANTLDLGLDRPAAVGTFENGVSPFGCYDLLGNVWEWVADRVPGRGENLEASASSVSAMGGSWRYRMQPVYALPEQGVSRVPVFNAISLAPETRSRDIGVRLGADAREYLLENSKSWGTDSEARRRLRAVGERFGDEALELVEELSELEGAAPGLAWLAEGARQ